MLDGDGDDGQRWKCSFCGRHATEAEGLTSNEDDSAATCVPCVESLHQDLLEDRSRPG